MEISGRKKVRWLETLHKEKPSSARSSRLSRDRSTLWILILFVFCLLLFYGAVVVHEDKCVLVLGIGISLSASIPGAEVALVWPISIALEQNRSAYRWIKFRQCNLRRRLLLASREVSARLIVKLGYDCILPWSFCAVG